MTKAVVRTLAEIHESRAVLRICRVCGKNIHIMCRKDTGICSENCEKESKRASE